MDACNNYGIGWFEPFSSKRIAFNLIYVADPLFSILPAIAFGFLVFLKTDHHHRIRWARAGVLTASIYLSFAFLNKYNIDRSVQSYLNSEAYSKKEYFTTPTLLNNLLWFVVVEDKTGYQIGYRSIFDRSDSLYLHHVNKNDSLLKDISDHSEVMELKKFSQGYYTIEKVGDTLVFNDLRFGQSSGWQFPKSKFAFHYYLSHPDENDLVVQRGRFAGFSLESARILLRRVMNEKK